MQCEKIRFKNFFSYGNSWTEIDLDQKKLVGIFGVNGVGKSILLDALFFAATGKAFRNKIKKSQIINSRNKKNCVVELYVSKGKDEYIIKRGIKPDIFEIIKNDKALDESAHVKDFQTILEQIFRFNLKVLKNTMFLSSMDYKPFLLFTLSEKREFIENILNLQIFGDMINNLKIDSSIIKKEKQEIDINFRLIEKEIFTINEMNKLIKDKRGVNKSKINQQISKLEKEIKEIHKDLEKNKKDLDKNQIIYDKKQEKFSIGIDKNEKEQQKISSKILLSKSDINKKNNSIKKENNLKNFFKVNSDCNTCKQEINKEHKTQIVNDINKRIKDLEEKKEKIIVDITTFQKNLDKVKKTRQKINDFGKKNYEFYEEKIVLEEKCAYNLRSRIDSSETLIKNHKDNLIEIETEDDLKDVSKKEEDKKSIEKELFIRNEKERIISFSKDLLSDTGIKLFIIKKYIPLLNKYVNSYLDQMNAAYRLKFNEEFQEKIILRGYENLSYHNLSSGEMQRCDLALLFAFLKIAKIKNSFDSNILILDEIIGNSLDQDGINGVLNILQSFKNEGKTIFIISHMDKVKNNLDKILYCEKKIFSKIN